MMEGGTAIGDKSERAGRRYLRRKEGGEGES